MSELRKAAQQALEALEYAQGGNTWIGDQSRKAIESLRAALAQPEPEPEPVAWMVYTLDGKSVCVTDNPADFTEQHKALPLYTAPPSVAEPHKRKPLTDDVTRAVSQCNAWWVAEITKVINDNTDGDGICCADDLLAAIRAMGSQGIGV